MLLKCIFLFSFWIATHQVLGAQKCYHCSTLSDLNCSDPFNNVSSICINEKEINCIKYSYALNGKKVVDRTCRITSDTCKDVKKAIKMENKRILDCSICSTDLCNSGTPLQLLIHLFFIIIFVIIT